MLSFSSFANWSRMLKNIWTWLFPSAGTILSFWYSRHYICFSKLLIKDTYLRKDSLSVYSSLGLNKSEVQPMLKKNHPESSQCQFYIVEIEKLKFHLFYSVEIEHGSKSREGHVDLTYGIFLFNKVTHFQTFCSADQERWLWLGVTVCCLVFLEVVVRD